MNHNKVVELDEHGKFVLTDELKGRLLKHKGPYTAQTASRRDPDWPIWYVADRNKYNCFGTLFTKDGARMFRDFVNEVSNDTKKGET